MCFPASYFLGLKNHGNLTSPYLSYWNPPAVEESFTIRGILFCQGSSCTKGHSVRYRPPAASHKKCKLLISFHGDRILHPKNTKLKLWMSKGPLTEGKRIPLFSLKKKSTTSLNVSMFQSLTCPYQVAPMISKDISKTRVIKYTLSCMKWLVNISKKVYGLEMWI